MPYTILIRGVLDGLGDSISVSDTMEIGDVCLGQDVFRPVGPVAFDVTLSNVGEAVIAAGESRATFRTTCVRCLCEFEREVVAEVDGFFVHAADEAGLPEEQDRDLIVDERIDLEPVVIDSLVVELPFAPLHSEDCAGICPSCGADLNAGRCECAPSSPASPFEVLREAFQQPSEESDEPS